MIMHQELEWKSIRMRNDKASGIRMEEHQERNDYAPGIGMEKHQDME